MALPWAIMEGEANVGEIGLQQLIRRLREEILEASLEAQASDLKFTLDDVEVEIEFAVMADAKAKGGMKLLVFELGGEVESGVSNAHRIKLKMLPARLGPGGEKEDVQVRDRVVGQPG